MACFLQLLLPVLLLLISPAHSLTCNSQTFPQSTIRYTNCTDLPSLKAYLHWAYNRTNSTLSIAFLAQPTKPEGWIAWGINPTATGMLGAQSFIAFKNSSGSLAVKTFNLSSYRSIEETTKPSFKVVESRGEYSDGTMHIFATLALPADMNTTLNQVWQVGGDVDDGLPEKHEMKPENMAAKGTLDLVTGQSNSGAGGGAPATGGGGGNKNAPSSASRMGTSLCAGVYWCLQIMGIFILGL